MSDIEDELREHWGATGAELARIWIIDLVLNVPMFVLALWLRLH